jgi:hypothetical protein
MASAVNWHLDVLPAEQRDLWEDRLHRGFADFVLYGGTALALRLGHRKSVDFDFFSSRTFAPLEFKEHNALEGEILQAGENTLTILHRGVKLSFFGGLSLGVVAPPDDLDVCPVASLEDLGACKLAALVNRVECKDYLDVAALLRHGASLAHLLGCANAVYRGEFPVTVCLKSLVWFDAPELSALPPEDREILETSALAVDEVPVIALQAPRIAAK